MSRKLTRSELLQEIFQDRLPTDKNEKLRMVRVRVPGREVVMAHVIGVSMAEVYRNTGLNTGVHTGEDHLGEAIGILKFTPWECTVVAADIATKSAEVEIGFMDRFSGTLILTGKREAVKTSLEGVTSFFHEELHFPVCPITES